MRVTRGPKELFINAKCEARASFISKEENNHVTHFGFSCHSQAWVYSAVRTPYENNHAIEPLLAGVASPLWKTERLGVVLVSFASNLVPVHTPGSAHKTESSLLLR